MGLLSFNMKTKFTINYWSPNAQKRAINEPPAVSLFVGGPASKEKDAKFCMLLPMWISSLENQTTQNICFIFLSGRRLKLKHDVCKINQNYVARQEKFSA